MTAQTDMRRRELAKIHVGKKELGLDDDCYRDIIRRITGGKKESSAKLTATERRTLLDEMKALGFKAKRKAAPSGSTAPSAPRRTGRAKTRQGAKARVLWRALWNLGEVQANTDSALDAFVKRQAGVDSLAWASPGQVRQVIEALRSWCARTGFDVPETAGGPEIVEAKRALVRAIWDRRVTEGFVKAWNGYSTDRVFGWFLHNELTMQMLPRAARLEDLNEAQLDEAEARLGKRLRASLEARRNAPRKADGDAG